MQTLFELEARTGFGGGSNIDDAPILDRNIGEAGGPDAIDTGFAQTLLSGTRSKWSEIRESVQQFAPQWPIERMDPITRSILMVAGYELLFANDAPPAVVMNEAIEIAKEFGTAEGAKFVNGVLNALAHRDERGQKAEVSGQS